MKTSAFAICSSISLPELIALNATSSPASSPARHSASRTSATLQTVLGGVSPRNTCCITGERRHMVPASRRLLTKTGRSCRSHQKSRCSFAAPTFCFVCSGDRTSGSASAASKTANPAVQPNSSMTQPSVFLTAATKEGRGRRLSTACPCLPGLLVHFRLPQEALTPPVRRWPVAGRSRVSRCRRLRA